MKHWIEQDVEQAKQREAGIAKSQDWQRHKADKLARESSSFWERLRATLAADAQAIGASGGAQITISAKNSDPGPETIRAERGKSPRLGFDLSHEQTTLAMWLRYYHRSNGARDDKGSRIILLIDVDDADGELGARIDGSDSSELLALDDLSRKLLRPLLFGDLQEVVKQGLVKS